MMRNTLSVALTSAAALALLTACELGEKEVQQTGYRGLGLEQIYDPDNFVPPAAVPEPPYPLPADEGPLAREVYQNVPVLGHLSAERFNHLMASITEWVSPEAGCNYCHNPANLASDEVYTKNIARRMLQMTWAINGSWATHVRDTGVTCYTCHRGQSVPQYVWANEPPPDRVAVRGDRRGQNAPNPNVGWASLPTDVFSAYFAGNPGVVRVASDSAYPSPANRNSIKTAEASYALMMHVSQSLGVNCTYCHNSQSFRDWSLSSAQRATAWYGIRMVRDANQNFIEPLAPILPPMRKGPAGDAYKVNCLTCHQGQAKPLAGVSMIADYPYLHPPVQRPVGNQVGPDALVPEALDEPEALTDVVEPEPTEMVEPELVEPLPEPTPTR